MAREKTGRHNDHPLLVDDDIEPALAKESLVRGRMDAKVSQLNYLTEKFSFH